MTIDFVPPMLDTCSIVEVSRNEYSDYVRTGTSITACRFRPIVSMNRGTNAEQNDADAQIWLAHDADVSIGSLVEFEDVLYQIERVDPSKRLHTGVVQFLKCDLKIFKASP